MLAGRRGALSKLLAIFGMGRSTYYYELRKADADAKNADLIAAIGRIFAEHRGNYGVRMVHRALLAAGVAVNHKKVQRIMRKLGLSARKHPRRYHYYQRHVGAVAANLIRRDFRADRPNRKWTTVNSTPFSSRRGFCAPRMLFVGERFVPNYDYDHLGYLTDAIVDVLKVTERDWLHL